MRRISVPFLHFDRMFGWESTRQTRNHRCSAQSAVQWTIGLMEKVKTNDETTDLKSATLRTPAQLAAAGLIGADDIRKISDVASTFDIAISPHMQALIDADDPADPIAAQFVPPTHSRCRRCSGHWWKCASSRITCTTVTWPGERGILEPPSPRAKNSCARSEAMSPVYASHSMFWTFPAATARYPLGRNI
jgi:hypothetical protein